MVSPLAYLDSASSEPLHPAARDVLLAAVDRGYADPRRLHGPGRDARLLLDNAREVVAASLGVRRAEVTFTSSGTDAVHRGLLGLAHARDQVGRTIVHTAVEHQSVFHATHWWGTPSVIAVDHSGVVAPDRLHRRLGADHTVAVAAVQHANHEVGTLQPIDDYDLGPVPLFVDACASMGRIALPQQWAAVAGSAHKWGGPAGVGVLVVRKGAAWESPFPGDDRIDERSSGFENVPAVLAAAAALQAVVAERDDLNRHHHEWVSRIRAAAATWDRVEVLGDAEARLPHLVTLAFERLDGEPIVDALDRVGIGVASGSACAASTLEPSHVMTALGSLDALTHGNLRISLARTTTEADVERVLAALPGLIAELRGTAAAQ